jgi:archaellum biogenesis ATPase FlaH
VGERGSPGPSQRSSRWPRAILNPSAPTSTPASHIRTTGECQPCGPSPPKTLPQSQPGFLDDILAGGYASNRAHLVEGRPGSGKTTLGLQFLLDGLRQGERCLYITLSESKRELLSAADRHGWSLDGLEIYELVPPELSLDPKQQQSLVYSSDLELGETVNMVLAEVERVRPSRMVFDSLSEIRLLSQGSLRYRRQVLADTEQGEARKRGLCEPRFLCISGAVVVPHVHKQIAHAHVTLGGVGFKRAPNFWRNLHWKLHFGVARCFLHGCAGVGCGGW